MMLRFLKRIFEEVLDFRNLLQRVVNLETLNIWKTYQTREFTKEEMPLP
jgi:hypothetical protein